MQVDILELQLNVCGKQTIMLPVKLAEVKLVMILERFPGDGFNFLLGSKIGATVSGRLGEGNRLPSQTLLLPIFLALLLKCSWRGLESCKLPVVQACLSGVRS